MRATPALIAAALLVAGCSSSTLPEDDQAFCSEQEDELADAHDAVQEIIDGDRHWSSDGEPAAIRAVVLDPASNYIRAFQPQDSRLSERVDAVGSTLSVVESDLLLTPDDAFADDAASSRDALAALDALQDFCDAEG